MGIDCTKLRQPCTMDGARVLHAWCGVTPRIGSAGTWGREPGRIGKGTRRRRGGAARTLRREAGNQGRCTGAPSMGSTRTVRREAPRIGKGAGTPREGSTHTEERQRLHQGKGAGGRRGGNGHPEAGARADRPWDAGTPVYGRWRGSVCPAARHGTGGSAPCEGNRDTYRRERAHHPGRGGTRRDGIA